jgi:predicted Ser/Thr protein kinase
MKGRDNGDRTHNPKGLTVIDFEQASIEEQSHVRNTFLARMAEIAEKPDAALRARVHVAALCHCAAQAAAQA